MKRILTFLFLFVLVSGMVCGRPVDESKARTVGINFLRSQVSVPAFVSARNLDLAYVSSSDDPRSPVYFYVFNLTSSPGFVIVAGDDAVTPVLGYSSEKAFIPSGIPPHVAAWLDSYEEQIDYAVRSGLAATPAITFSWETYSRRPDPVSMPLKTTASFPLVQTKWDQSPYYNDLCPYDYNYNDRTVTGCVATAMAQIMKYWGFPVSGSGFHSYNHNTYGTLSADFGSATYDYASMPNMLNGSNNAVATLMYHCGVSVDMNYGVGSQGGSGAYVVSSQSPVQHCSEYSLKTYFGYPASLQGVVRENYSEAQWISLLKTELDASRPVLYAGFGSGGGHCFVCDGYDASNYFHFNWGWSGNYDGYFEINALNPGGVGTGGGTGGFNSGHQAVIGIQGSGGGGQTPSNLGLYDYVTVNPSNMTYGSSFTVHTDIGNFGSSTFSGDYCAAIFDNNDVFVDFVEIIYGASLQAGYHYTNGLDFSNDGLLTMLPGTYSIGIYYRPTGGNWYQVDDYQNYTNFAQVTVTWSNDLELYEAMTVSPGITLTRGQSVSVHLDVVNTGSTTFSGTLDVSLYNLDGSFAFTIDEMTDMNLPPNYHYTNGLTFTNPGLDAEPGTYLLAMQYYTGGYWELTGSTNYQNPIQVTVVEGSLQADMYEPNNTAAQSYSIPVNFSGNTASLNTFGSNCHEGTDYDFYRIDLSPGFTYTIAPRLNDEKSSNNGQTYTVDAIFSISTDGTNWSDAYDDVMQNNIVSQNGGSVYFLVSPKFTGHTGTYQLDIFIAKNPAGTGGSEPEAIRIYPNPAGEKISADLTGFDQEVSEAELINSQGQPVRSLDIRGLTRFTLSVGDLPEGIYFLKFEGNRGSWSKRIVVKR